MCCYKSASSAVLQRKSLAESRAVRFVSPYRKSYITGWTPGIKSDHRSAWCSVTQEVEIKLRLAGSDDYDAVAAALAPAWKQDHQQENYFFDGAEGELSKELAILRCRFYDTDKKAVLTVKGKMKIKDGVGRAPEVEEEVDPAEARGFLSSPEALAGHGCKLMEDCRSNFGFKSLVCLGGFRNLRREFDWEGHLLELDKTTYEHGTLYEVEVETENPAELQVKLEEFLRASGVSFSHSTTSKFANFRNKTLE
eukprot:CAMPEP_0177599954 /NCGR_PEP_ID=MMETSP0419_2-20121207/13318_1 /TAXON_ID=582737 /ORGANISM="Tetraselmis sp., Strain GSL018" /LENGTH=251 /DNA_ID=CAMNT_0019092821 /DNA_START=242 /DNA_END=997 /DNA_ORIENTATION=-